MRAFGAYYLPSLIGKPVELTLNPRRLLSRAWGNLRYRLNNEWFETMERHGLHTKLVHYYSPIPDTRTLGDELWTNRSAMPGIDMRVSAQLSLLQEFETSFRSEYEGLARRAPGAPHHFDHENTFFNVIDAEVLWCMIRKFRPKRIIEIGSGNSTYLAAEALARNGDGTSKPGELISIEPYPNDVLRRGFPGLTQLIQRPVQEIPISLFESLEPNDILFIDSSHVVRIGSDVVYEFLEILPRVGRGVLVHVHDIFFPEEYPREWVFERHDFWNEQYLLQAFLSFNESFEILWAGHYLTVQYPELMRRAFASWPRQGSFCPASFWMRRAR